MTQAFYGFLGHFGTFWPTPSLDPPELAQLGGFSRHSSASGVLQEALHGTFAAPWVHLAAWPQWRTRWDHEKKTPTYSQIFASCQLNMAWYTDSTSLDHMMSHGYSGMVTARCGPNLSVLLRIVPQWIPSHCGWTWLNQLCWIKLLIYRFNQPWSQKLPD